MTGDMPQNQKCETQRKTLTLLNSRARARTRKAIYNKRKMSKAVNRAKNEIICRKKSVAGLILASDNIFGRFFIGLFHEICRNKKKFGNFQKSFVTNDVEIRILGGI